jgi:hypothetical protein
MVGPSKTTTPTAARPSASSTTDASGRPDLIFAALQGDPGANGTLGASTVMVVGASGQVLAKATFAARNVPEFGRAATLLQPEARVANGRVYYADAIGTVRTLSPNGQVELVTTFPMSPQTEQELSFAVSGDGRSLMASVITLPAVISHDQSGGSLRDPNGHFSLDLYIAAAGGPAQRIRRQDLGTKLDAAASGNLQMVGWDAAGPLATVNTLWATQQGMLGRFIFGSPLVHLGTSGTLGPPVGGADCQPAGFYQDGRVVCISPGSQVVTLRTASGAIEWSATAPGSAYLMSAVPSPDGTTIALGNGLLHRDGSFVKIPLAQGEAVLQVEGWLDSRTIIGAMPCFGANPTCGHLARTTVDAMSSVTDLGFTARFVGLISR